MTDTPVSIHARHLWRANLRASQSCRAVVMFQSTPAISGGRTRTMAAGLLHTSQFQSTPAISGGRTSARIAPALTWQCFNPRPPSLAGEPDPPRSECFGLVVSIHARHLWRANLPPAGFFHSLHRFQSTPAISGGRTLRRRQVHAQLHFGFNPRPPSLAGEPPPHAKRPSGQTCFNPRPPSLAGEPAW